MTNTYEQNKEVFKDFIIQVNSLNYCFQKSFGKKLLNKFSFEFSFADDFEGRTRFIIYFDCGSYVMSKSFTIDEYETFKIYCDGIRDTGYAINGRS